MPVTRISENINARSHFGVPADQREPVLLLASLVGHVQILLNKLVEVQRTIVFLHRAFFHDHFGTPKFFFSGRFFCFSEFLLQGSDFTFGFCQLFFDSDLLRSDSLDIFAHEDVFLLEGLCELLAVVAGVLVLLAFPLDLREALLQVGELLPEVGHILEQLLQHGLYLPQLLGVLPSNRTYFCLHLLLDSKQLVLTGLKGNELRKINNRTFV